MIIDSFKALIKDCIPSSLYYKFLCLKKRRQIGNNIGLLKNNSVFKDIHKGKRCFILGNGPSLNNIDLSCLANEITFSVNQLPRREDFKKLSTNYHLWSDARFFKINEDQFVIHRLIDKCNKVVTVSKSLYFYLKHNNSIMGSNFNVKRLDYLDALKDRIKFFEEKKYYDLCDKTKSTLLWYSAIYFCYIDLSKDINNEIKKSIKLDIKSTYNTYLKDVIFSNYTHNKEKLLAIFFNISPSLIKCVIKIKNAINRRIGKEL